VVRSAAGGQNQTRPAHVRERCRSAYAPGVSVLLTQATRDGEAAAVILASGSTRAANIVHPIGPSLAGVDDVLCRTPSTNCACGSRECGSAQLSGQHANPGGSIRASDQRPWLRNSIQLTPVGTINPAGSSRAARALTRQRDCLLSSIVQLPLRNATPRPNDDADRGAVMSRVESARGAVVMRRLYGSGLRRGSA